MKRKIRMAVLGSALALLTGVLGGAAHAAQPPVSINTVYNKVVEIYNYLVNTITPKLNSILSSLTNDRADNLDAVSTELGMLAGIYRSGLEEDSDGFVDIATVGTLGELARYTVTIAFYQGDADDYGFVYLSQDGQTYSILFDLRPGVGEQVVQTATVVATHINLGAHYLNPNFPGAEPISSTSALSWSISAVGAPGTPELTVYP